MARKKRRVSVGLSAERTRQTVVATPAAYGGSTATQLPGPSTLTRTPAMPMQRGTIAQENPFLEHKTPVTSALAARAPRVLKAERL